ncbi:MAG: protein translocase subunit SecD [Armatimonadota bacterium]|nr:protein translocase subunit SecD [bacterium]
MSRYQKLFVLVIALAIAAGAVAYLKPLRKGLDIAGGIRVVMQADPKRGDDWPKTHQERVDKMESIRKTIAKRMAAVAEPKVTVAGEDRLVVELPGVKNPTKALNEIKKTASLEFFYLKDVQNVNNSMGKWKMDAPASKEDSYIFTGPNGEIIDSVKQPEEVMSKVVDRDRNKPLLTGKDLLPNAKANLNQQSQIVINIEFNDSGREIFKNFTRSHIDDYLAVFFDGKLLTAPKINEAIPSGSAEISGFSSLPEAKKTAEFLNAGALPIPLKVISKDQVEPTLGDETVHQVVFAGIIGLALVVLFMLLYYRLPGLIASIALCLYALFVIAAFKLIGATMSLAGIAALIISIGMAVDANILIFERLKEELRSGKTLRAAIDAGFNRAFTAIFDSNMCTAITCAILMWYGSPSVVSFATTLIIGVAISMFTAITVTRTILHLLVNAEWAQSPKLFGLGTSWMHHVTWNIVGKKAYFFILSGILIIPGLVVLSMYGLKPGIEFKSGTSVQATFNQRVQLDAVRSEVSKYSKESEIQLGSDGKVAFIKTLPLSESKEEAMRADLDQKFNMLNGKFDSVSSVEPTISKELTTNAFLAVLIASGAIILYLTGRFAISGIASGLKYGVCAVIALIHDAAFILGLFAILGKVLGWEVDSLFVTAVLTIIGFSVHDTIVVFDRIRENLRHRQRGESFEQLANRSILQTLSRSINTSFTVVLTLAMLIVFGGPLLRHFYVALLVGIIIGTYSSIFNATPLVIVWEYLASKSAAPKKKESEGKVLVEKPIESPIDVKPIAESSEAIDTTEVDSTGSNGSNGNGAARIKRKTAKKRRY